MIELVKNISGIFFEKLGVDYSELQVYEEGENIFRIALKSNDSHLLIGPHGKNLEVVTHLIRTLLSTKSDPYLNIHVEVNDYLEKKDEKLRSFIQGKIDYVKSSGKEIILPFLTAYERKKVHSFVSDTWWNVYTQSVGEGAQRRIHLCKKDEKMTIDLDGDDI